MSHVLVVAPHPDDETLGCGGTLLKHRAGKDRLHWLIATKMVKEKGVTVQTICERSRQIEKVNKAYEFESVHQLGFPTTRVDTVPMSHLIRSISNVFKKIRPEIIYLPYPGDAHTDHRAIFEAAWACTKWFRNQSVKKILAYETLSETDFGHQLFVGGFQPNVFRDITDVLDKKLKIMEVYVSELSTFPFPRSRETILALAALRGSQSGFRAAEAFMLLKEIV